MANRNAFPGIQRTAKRTPAQDAVYESIEVLTGQRGNGENRALLLKDLVNLDALTKKQLIRSSQNNSNAGGLPVNTTAGIESPHAPVGVSAVGGFTFIAIMWEPPTYKGHAYAEIYRGDTNVFNDATLIATEVTDIFSNTVNMGSSYYYWVRFVNKVDVRGPLNGANGLLAETMESAEAILAELGGKIEDSHLGDFLSGEVGKIPDLEFDIDEARLAADEVLTSNEGMAADLINAALANDQNWESVTASIAALSVVVDSNQASVTSDYHTKANSEAAMALKIEEFQAFIEDPEGTSLGATLHNDYYTVVAGNQAIATANSELKAIIEDENGNSLGASLHTLSETVATNDEQWAMWAVQTNVNGITSGFGLVNDGADPIFAIKGAKFAVITDQDPSNATPVFGVVDNKTVIKSALIDEAHIQTLVTDDLLSNRIIAGSQLTTPSINYDPDNGNRSQNFSMSPTGVMHAKAAVLESVTIKDADGNVVMSSTGALAASNITGLGALSGLDKILKTNVTTYIESGSIGSAQIDDAYIAELFGDNATFSGTVYAKNMEGDVTDSKAKTSTAFANSASSHPETTVLSFSVSSMPFARTIVVAGVAAYSVEDYNASHGASCTFSLYKSGVLQDQFKASSVGGGSFAGGTNVLLSRALSASIGSGSSGNYTITVDHDANGSDYTKGHESQKVLIQVFKDGSTLS